MSLFSPEITPVSPCSEVQYVVLQNVATMTIKRRVSWTGRNFERHQGTKRRPRNLILSVLVSNRECLNRI